MSITVSKISLAFDITTLIKSGEYGAANILQEIFSQSIDKDKESGTYTNDVIISEENIKAPLSKYSNLKNNYSRNSKP